MSFTETRVDNHRIISQMGRVSVGLSIEPLVEFPNSEGKGG